MTFQIIHLPLLFGSIFALGLSFRFLGGPQKDRVQNRLLAAVLIIGSWQLFTFVMMFSGNVSKIPHVGLTGFPMEFLIGPLYYLYSSLAFRGKVKLSPFDTLHALPYFLAILFFKDFYLLDAQTKAKILSTDGNPELGSLSLPFLLIFVSILLSKGIYFSLFLKNLRQFENLVLNRTSNSSIVQNLERYRTFTWMFLGYVIIFAALLVALSTWQLYGAYLDYIWYTLKTGFIFTFAYFALVQRNQSINSNPLCVAHLTIDETTDPDDFELPSYSTESIKAVPRKYANSGLSKSRMDVLREKLLTYLQTEKPYLDSDLSLISLSQRLKIHPNHLSQVINQNFKQSFSAFINTYRIEHAKTLLSIENTEQPLSVIEIAFSSGFNSKPSFNRVFKQATSMTPSQFRDTLNAHQKTTSLTH